MLQEGKGEPHHDVLWEKVVAEGAVVEVDLVEGLLGQLDHVALVVAPVLVLADDLLPHAQLMHGRFVPLGNKERSGCSSRTTRMSGETFSRSLPRSGRGLCGDSRWRERRRATLRAAWGPPQPGRRWGGRQWGSGRASIEHSSRTPSSSSSYSSNTSVGSHTEGQGYDTRVSTTWRLSFPKIKIILEKNENNNNFIVYIWKVDWFVDLNQDVIVNLVCSYLVFICLLIFDPFITLSLPLRSEITNRITNFQI